MRFACVAFLRYRTKTIYFEVYSSVSIDRIVCVCWTVHSSSVLNACRLMRAVLHSLLHTEGLVAIAAEVAGGDVRLGLKRCRLSCTSYIWRGLAQGSGAVLVLKAVLKQTSFACIYTQKYKNSAALLL